MAIFPNIELEGVVQVNDKTRLNAVKTFVSKDEAAITLVEIEPEAAAGFIDVTGTSSSDYFLDWEYATDGAKTVTVRVTTDGSPVTSTGTLTIITVADDKLFSADSDLINHEQDILRYVPDGRNSFLNVHRQAQELIVAWLDENGWIDVFADKFTKDDLDTAEMKQWSKFLTLRLIFENLSNSTDDIFFEKMTRYQSLEIQARKRAAISIDIDADGTIDKFEDINAGRVRLWRL